MAATMEALNVVEAWAIFIAHAMIYVLGCLYCLDAILATIARNLTSIADALKARQHKQDNDQ